MRCGGFWPGDPLESASAPMSPPGAPREFHRPKPRKHLPGIFWKSVSEILTIPDPADVLGELKADKFRGICAVGCPDKPADDLIDRFTGSINAFSKIVGDLSGLQ